MAKAIKPTQLGKVLGDELTIYSREVTEKVDQLSEQAVKALAKKTKATAPKKTGEYRKHISSKLLKATDRGSTYVWFVRAPEHRLTHLLVKGVPTRNGGRTKENPFLRNALDEVLPDYEKAIEEAVSNGG